MHIIRSLLAVVAVSLPAIAHADGSTLSVVRSQFTDKVEQSNPVAGADALGHPSRVTYWVAMKNDAAPTTVTLVWKLDGHEAGRQSLDVGTSPAWKTWGTHWVGGAKSVEVDVLDATGATVKTDTLALSSGGEFLPSRRARQAQRLPARVAVPSRPSLHPFGCHEARRSAEVDGVRSGGWISSPSG